MSTTESIFRWSDFTSNTI